MRGWRIGYPDLSGASILLPAHWLVSPVLLGNKEIINFINLPKCCEYLWLIVPRVSRGNEKGLSFYAKSLF